MLIRLIGVGMDAQPFPNASNQCKPRTFTTDNLWWGLRVFQICTFSFCWASANSASPQLRCKAVCTDLGCACRFIGGTMR